LLEVKEETDSEGRLVLEVTRRDTATERLLLTFAADAQTVRRADLHLRNGRATVEFRTLGVDVPTHSALFRPTEGVALREVPSEDLIGIFRAVFGFAVTRINR